MNEPISACKEIKPFGECGIFGSCEDLFSPDSNLNQSQQCSCEPGWEQTSELTLFLFSREDFDLKLTPCNSNTTLLYVLYAFAFIFGLVPAAYQFTVLGQKGDRLKQLKRQGAFLLGLSSQSAVALYRLIKMDTALLGEDILFSALLANSGWFNLIAMSTFNNRYFQFLEKKVLEIDHDSNTFLNVHKKVSRLNILLDFCFYQLLWIPSTFSDEDKLFVGRIILKLAFFLFGFRMVYFLVSTYLIFSKFIKDMKNYIVMANDLSAQTNPERSKTAAYIKKKLLPNIQNFFRLTIPFGVFFMVVCFACGVWDWALLQFIYLNSFIMIFWGATNFVAIRSNAKRAKYRLHLFRGARRGKNSSLSMLGAQNGEVSKTAI